MKSFQKKENMDTNRGALPSSLSQQFYPLGAQVTWYPQCPPSPIILGLSRGVLTDLLTQLLRPHLGGTSFRPETRHTSTRGTGGTRAGPAQVLGFSSEARAPPRSSVPPGLRIFQAWCFPQPTPQQIHLA